MSPRSTKSGSDRKGTVDVGLGMDNDIWSDALLSFSVKRIALKFLQCLKREKDTLTDLSF